MKRPIYLDYAATTPVDPRVAARMSEFLTLEGVFGNPSSTSHGYGWAAQEAIDAATDELARLIGANRRNILWTSGATESNNLALKGTAEAHPDKGRHIITCATEHKSVLDTCRYLQTKGLELTILKPQKNGLVDLNQLESALRPDTLIVSIMHVNNEIGVVQDIEAIGQLVHAKGAYFHVDAAQSLGKIPFQLKTENIDLMSFSAHKLYGPKGVGALYVRDTAAGTLKSQMHGGGHQRGMRSGTMATHQIAGMGEACSLVYQDLEQESERILMLREKLHKGLNAIEGVSLNGDPLHRVPGILNVSFEGVQGEPLMLALKQIAVSSGSACSSENSEPSHVLKAIGLSHEAADTSIRFSVGRFTTEEDIEHTIAHVTKVVQKLRSTLSLWSMKGVNPEQMDK